MAAPALPLTLALVLIPLLALALALALALELALELLLVLVLASDGVTIIDALVVDAADGDDTIAAAFALPATSGYDAKSPT
jgi:hypothetical protein